MYLLLVLSDTRAKYSRDPYGSGSDLVEQLELDPNPVVCLCGVSFLPNRQIYGNHKCSKQVQSIAFFKIRN